jgi:hypothetical protein
MHYSFLRKLRAVTLSRQADLPKRFRQQYDMNQKQLFIPGTAVLIRLSVIIFLAGHSGIHAADQADYLLFDELLLENVRNGFVDYDGFLVDPRFQHIIEKIGTTEPDSLSGRNEKLAFYINAYNALAIDGIIKGGSPSSLWSRRKFFRNTKHEVLGEQLTLDDIEHKRIGALGEPRVHFAIVCASLSCPRLSNRAYTPERIDYQLHDAARRFINDPTRNQYDIERGSAFISMIFKWYRDDFAAAGGSVQGYISRFATDGRVADALRRETFAIRYQDYDWNLNGHLSENPH